MIQIGLSFYAVLNSYDGECLIKVKIEKRKWK